MAGRDAHGPTPVEGRKKVRPAKGIVHQFRGTFFLLDPRQTPFRERSIQLSPLPRGRPFGATDQPAKDQAMWLVRVELPRACFGFEVIDNG